MSRDSSCTVRLAHHGDRDQLAALRHSLWPEGPVREHLLEFDNLIATGMNGTLPTAVFVAIGNDNSPIGFLEVGLRSHADGCDPTSAVAFIEGWYVSPGHRRQGVGKTLIRAAEGWARLQGCAEMASDALIDNEPSHHAHRAAGFEIVDRCVHFRKSL